MFNKRGAIENSVTALVLIVLAMALILLGIFFIRMQFQLTTAKVQEAVSIDDLKNPPTQDNALTLTPDELRLNKKDKNKIYFQ